MFLRAVSLNKTLLVSTIVHLAMAGVMFGTSPEKRVEPIELSFGTFGVAGGGDGRQVGAPPAAAKPKKIASVPTVKPAEKSVSILDSGDEVSTAASSTAPAGQMGEGGTGLGVGQGVGLGTGGGNSTDPRALYAGQIGQLIQKNLHYPLSARKLGQQGTVLMNITIAKDGNILKYEIKEKSHYQAFNTSSLDTIRRLGKFPPIPKEIGLEVYDVIIPVKYTREI